MTLKTIFLSAAALALLGGAAPANASGQDNASHMVVSYYDLDIQHAPGAARLLGRIRNAASRVCAPEPNIRDISDRQVYRACMDNAISEAVAAVGSPLVSDLLNGISKPVSIAKRD